MSVRIFLSSTWIDLEPERAEVEATLHRLGNTQFVGMEYFGSRDDTPRDVSLTEVDRSDIYIGIFAHRYGSGITEAEYRRASERNLHRLLYFKDDHVPVIPSFVERDPAAAERLANLKRDLREHHVISTFDSPGQLAARVVADLHNVLVTWNDPSQLVHSLSTERTATAELSPSLSEIIRLYLAATHEDEQYAELDQAGESDPDRTTLLRQVFVDLDVQVRRSNRFRVDQVPIDHWLETEQAYEDIFLENEGKCHSALDFLRKEKHRRVVLIGGPGQGKSTLGQYFAQAHRAALLGLSTPSRYHRGRIPFRVILKYYAQWVEAQDATPELEQYLVQLVGQNSRRTITEQEIQQLMQARPCLLIFDGLDEVVNEQLRARVLSSISRFLARSEVLQSDTMILATSRPTGYNCEFAQARFLHLDEARS